MKQSHAKTVFTKLSKLDWRVVKRKLKEKNLSGNSPNAVLKEGLRYLSLFAVTKEALAPSTMVDICWDEMVLDTPTYHQTVPIIGYFVHHNQSHTGRRNNARDQAILWRTIQLYEDHFGEPNLKIWGLTRK